jgi:hypothetical protein
MRRIVCFIGVLAVLCGCGAAQQASTTTATSPRGELMRIEYERSGGFAGITRSASLSSDTMSASERDTAQRLVDEAAFFELPENADGDPMPDGFTYRITVVTTTSSHTVEVNEPNVPAELIPLLDWLDSMTSRSGSSN